MSPIAVGTYLQSAFAKAELHILEGGDHLFAEKYPDQTATFIAHYLAQWEC